MTEKDKKRFKNDTRREHTDRLTGEKWKHKIQQEKINEADRDIKDFCNTNEDYILGLDDPSEG